MICKKCGNELKTEDQFCSKCGTPISNENTQQINNKKKTFLGIENNITLQSKTKNKKKTKITGIVPGIVLIIGLIIVFSLISNSTKTIDSNYSVLKTYISPEEFSNINSIITKCGFTNYNITRDDSIDNLWEENTIGFRIKSNQSNNSILYIKNGTIYNIRYADIDLYKNGEYLDNISNYYISDNDRSYYITQSKEIINKLLKSPSTAKYPWSYSEWPMKKENGQVTIQGYVDAQNSFGAVTRSNFQIILTDNSVTSLIFDGQEYIK